jgi:diketogulonate reductase-like aldo/keto reductase
MKHQTLTEIFASNAEGLKASVTLNNGVRLPWIGLGVFQMPGDEATAAAVKTAVSLGYRSIDTATIYGNERGVGMGVRASDAARPEIFITTKVWNDDMRGDRVEAAFEESMERLGLGSLDLYLLHWPIKGKLVSSWRALERLYRAGRIKAIGVSNFMIPHLNELLAEADIVPAVNQIEFHPYLQSKPLVEYCRRKGIVVEAWSPLMQAGPILRDPALAAIARGHGRTVAQVILRWDAQSGVVAIPKSANPRRIAENAGIFDFALTEPEMAVIDALDRGQRSGADPFNFNF